MWYKYQAYSKTKSSAIEKVEVENQDKDAQKRPIVVVNDDMHQNLIYNFATTL